MAEYSNLTEFLCRFQISNTSFCITCKVFRCSIFYVTTFRLTKSAVVISQCCDTVASKIICNYQEWLMVKHLFVSVFKPTSCYHQYNGSLTFLVIHRIAYCSSKHCFVCCIRECYFFRFIWIWFGWILWTVKFFLTSFKIKWKAISHLREFTIDFSSV